MLTATFWTDIAAPWGRLSVVTNGDGHLIRIDVSGGGDHGRYDPDRCGKICVQLSEYFAGLRQNFTVPLALEGTRFQRRVWDELCRIAYGQTISYGELAARIGQPRAARAVGSANGANPVPIVVPCHRVIAAGGALGGYTGGLDVKRSLLGLEGWSLAA